jgi:hypothetical protein
MTAENMMNIIKTDIKNMQDIAPLIDDDIISIYNAKYRKYKRVKKPNFVNGLTDVVVNSNNNEYEYEYSSRHGSREGSPANTQQQQQQQLSVPSHDPEYDQQLQSQTQALTNTSISKMNETNNIINGSIRADDDNDSVDPIQPTIIQTVNNNNSVKSGSQSFRKAPELSVPVTSSVNVPPVVVEQPQQPNPLDLMRLLTQLQQQGIGTGIAGANIISQPLQIAPQVLVTSTPPLPLQPSLSPSQPHAVAQINDVIVPIPIDVDVAPSVSPSGSIRSNSSLPLGSIQTDNSGNQIVNT